MEFIDKVKNWLLGVGAFLFSILTILFLFQRSKNQTNEALLKQQDLDKKLAANDALIAKNNEALASEEKKREEIQKENAHEPTTNEVIDLFNRRK